MPEFTSII